jgi:hypothetical protein
LGILSHKAILPAFASVFLTGDDPVERGNRLSFVVVKILLVSKKRVPVRTMDLNREKNLTSQKKNWAAKELILL